MCELDATDGAVEKALDKVEEKLHNQFRDPQYTQCTKNGIPRLCLDKDVKNAGGRLSPLEFDPYMIDLLARMKAHQRGTQSLCIILADVCNGAYTCSLLCTTVFIPKTGIAICNQALGESYYTDKAMSPSTGEYTVFHIPQCVGQHYWLGTYKYTANYY